MGRVFRALVVSLALSLFPLVAWGQQFFRLPDIKALKHLTTKQVDHAQDIPGNETTVDYYSAPNGQVITIYSYRARAVAFSTHSNSDVQGTYRFFMDLSGDGKFQEVARNPQWQLPPWARMR